LPLAASSCRRRRIYPVQPVMRRRMYVSGTGQIPDIYHIESQSELEPVRRRQLRLTRVPHVQLKCQWLAIFDGTWHVSGPSRHAFQARNTRDTENQESQSPEVRSMDQLYPKFSYQTPDRWMDHTRRSGAAFNNSMVHITRSYQLRHHEPRWRLPKWWWWWWRWWWWCDDSYKTMKTSHGTLDWLLAARWMRTHHRVSATYVTCAVDVEMEPPMEHMSTHHMQLQIQRRVPVAASGSTWRKFL